MVVEILMEFAIDYWMVQQFVIDFIVFGYSLSLQFEQLWVQLKVVLFVVAYICEPNSVSNNSRLTAAESGPKKP